MKLWQYIQGSRKGKEAHRIEKEAMKDPFLADALEGYDKVKGNHQKEVARLQKEITRLQKRITLRSANKKPNSLRAWSIAASVLLIIGAGTWFLWDKFQPAHTMFSHQEDIVAQKTEVTTPEVQEESPIVSHEETDEVNTKEKTEKPETTKDKIQEKVLVQPKDRAVAMEPEAVVIGEDMASVSISEQREESVSTFSATTRRTDSDIALVDTTKTNVEINALQQAQAKATVVSPTLPQPVAGMQAYQNYIQRNLIRPTDGECRDMKGPIVVVFKVGQSGRPYNIRVTQGLCTSSNKEAIRLIINGPDWKKGTESDEATITIQF